jgi:peptidoglycan/LPS O-acetylase OafA/YrhL
VKYLASFLIGAALFVHRDRVPLNGWLALASTLPLLLTGHTAARELGLVIGLPYLVLYAALAHPLAFDPRRAFGEWSYGIYIFAFPVQQSLVALLGTGIGPWGLTALALPPTLLLAALSWRFVEAPALRLRRRMRGSGEEAPVAGTALSSA